MEMGNNMKKRKIFKLFLLTALILIVGVGSYLLYEFKFKTYDVADDAVTEIISDPYTVELPDGSTITIDEKGNVVEGAKITSTNGAISNGTTTGTDTSNESTDSGTATKTDGATSSSEGSANSTGTTTTNGTTTPTVASVKEKYIPVFQGLEAQADSKINALVGRAMAEYKDRKANGEGIDFGYFYNKYMSAANGLEASTDTIFNGVLAAVEKDLVRNGFDKSYAQSFKEEYEATKKARRDSLLSKAFGS